ncbi:hypothetical protein CBL_06539 [Carabus blaptoides fortunei]
MGMYQSVCILSTTALCLCCVSNTSTTSLDSSLLTGAAPSSHSVCAPRYALTTLLWVPDTLSDLLIMSVRSTPADITRGVLTVAVDVAAAARSFRSEKTEVTRVDTIFSNALERCSCFKQLCAVYETNDNSKLHTETQLNEQNQKRMIKSGRMLTQNITIKTQHQNRAETDGETWLRAHCPVKM